MPFLDHLEELRWRLIKSLAAILVGAGITFAFIDPIIAILIKPTEAVTGDMKLQVLTVQGMFMIKWGMALVGGIILAIPVLTYQIWKFVSPGMYTHERKYLGPVIMFTFLSFLAGVFFAYHIIIPFSIQFFTGMGYDFVQNNFSINYYFNFVTWLMLGAGAIFELPVIIFILSSLGIVTPKFLRTYRRHAIVVILILSAVITPPDPISLVIMAIPLWCLYELSIGVSWLVYKGKRNKQAASPAATE